MTAPLLLYHTGFSEIRRPDVAFGRKNADFGRGFYLSDDPEFARRWARRRRGADTVLNVYELDSAGLTFLRLDRDETWFDYIARNRAGGEDRLRGADVIVGPIANDTLYDTMGLFTSGLLDRAQALSLLLQGPLYGRPSSKRNGRRPAFAGSPPACWTPVRSTAAARSSARRKRRIRRCAPARWPTRPAEPRRRPPRGTKFKSAAPGRSRCGAFFRVFFSSRRPGGAPAPAAATDPRPSAPRRAPSAR